MSSLSILSSLLPTQPSLDFQPSKCPAIFTTIILHPVLSGLSMLMANSTSSILRAMATSSLCRHHLVSTPSYDSMYRRLTSWVEDTEDPLNWTKKRKLLHTACMVMYTVMMVFPSAAVYSVAKPISTSTGISITTINRGTGVMFLLYGWSTIVWQAIALQYGKRPVYLVSAAASVVVMAVAPMCRTSGTYLAIRILQVICLLRRPMVVRTD